MQPLRKLVAHLAGGLGVIGIALFFLVFSCSQKLPIAPVAPSQVSSQTAGPAPVRPLSSLPVVGKLIDWLGGTLLIPIENTNDTSLLIVPKWSLLKAVLLTVNAHFDENENATFYECGPDGLKFLRPALLLHRARESNGKVLNLWYFNPEKQRWEKYDSARVIAGVATFRISHFSKWAVTPEGDGLGSGGQQ